MHPSSVTTAVSADSLSIPLIDFSAFLHGDESTRRATAQAVLAGFQNAGFIYLSNHGIAPETVKTTFAESARFFTRPQAQKDDMAWTTPEANRGYSGAGREKTTDLVDAEDVAAKRATEGADLKESFEIGREGVEGMPNQWPGDRGYAGDEQEAKEFRDKMLAFFDQCKQLHMEVMSAIAVGIGIAPDWFDPYCDGGDNTLRLLHYPEVAAEVFKQNKNQVRAGAHTDYGSITLLFQDMRGGLQVLSPNGNFIDAKPIEGAIVVNAGDLLARWSNDVIKSTKHRVVEPPGKEGEEMHPPRYSIAYFCNPNSESWIDAIPGTYEEGEGSKGKKYEGVNSGEYLVRRLQATY